MESLLAEYNRVITEVSELRESENRLRAEVASLKEERDEHEKHDAARDEKIRILTTYHGLGCACSYDSVDDVCEHHSPKLMALTQQLATANGRVEMLSEAIRQTLDENRHLADGDTCTLILLKRAISNR